MDQRQYRVELNRKPPIGRGDQRAFPGNADRLADQVCLSGAVSHVLDYGGGVNVVEGLVLERQRKTVRADEGEARVKLFEVRCIVDADRGDTVLVGIPGREIVRVVVALIAGRAYVEYGVVRGDAETDRKVEDLAPLISGDPHRQRSRPRDIVLSTHPRPARFSIRSMARSLRGAIFSFQHRRLN